MKRTISLVLVLISIICCMPIPGIREVEAFLAEN